MMHSFFKSSAWEPIESVLSFWESLYPQVPEIKLEDPLKVGIYEEFRRNNCPPMIRESNDYTCNGIKLQGDLSVQNPYKDLVEVIDYGREFKDINTFVSLSVYISYQEKGVKQEPMYRNNVGIRFQDSESTFTMYIGGKSRYLLKENLYALVNKIEAETCFQIGDLTNVRPELGFSRPWDSALSTRTVVDGVKTVMDLVGYDFIASVDWTFACPTFYEAEQFGIKCLNRIAELKIPAERYILDLQCRYKKWEAVENLRPLCGPSDRLIHPLGLLKLPKRGKLGFYFLTSAEGHQLAVGTSKPLKEMEISTNLVHRLESLGIDFEHTYTDKELLNK